MAERTSYAPGPARGARIHKKGSEKWTFVLARELRHSPEIVWQALTDPAQLREWAPYDASGNLGATGNTVKLTTVGAPALFVTDATVTRAEPYKVLVYNWGDQDVRWELEAIEGGTRLTLWATIARGYVAMGAAGWHICFDVLGRLLGGDPIGRIVGKAAFAAGLPQLQAEYARLFETESPDDAAQPDRQP